VAFDAVLLLFLFPAIPVVGLYFNGGGINKFGVQNSTSFVSGFLIQFTVGSLFFAVSYLNLYVCAYYIPEQ
jgi:hypothetical protein